MNLLDKAISIVAPRVALQRVRSRVALELTTGYLERHAQRFRYEGATAGRRAHGWYAASTDANVELMGSLIWLRNRSRDLIRNNPYAARAVEELAGNVVGTGIVPKAKTGNTAIDKIIDAEWPFFADGLRHAAAPRLLWHADADRPHHGGDREKPLCVSGRDPRTPVCAFRFSFKCSKPISSIRPARWGWSTAM